MASHQARTFELGERVCQYGQPYRWAVIVAWPPDAPEDIKRMRTKYEHVRLEHSQVREEEIYQYWPKVKIRRADEPDRPEAKERPFTDED